MILSLLALILIILVSNSCLKNKNVIRVSCFTSNDLYQVLHKEKNINTKRHA